MAADSGSMRDSVAISLSEIDYSAGSRSSSGSMEGFGLGLLAGSRSDSGYVLEAGVTSRLGVFSGGFDMK